MLKFDATKWRALGLDAELTALLVACVNAANRTPKPGTPGRGIQSMSADPAGGLRIAMTDGSETLVEGILVRLLDDTAAEIAASAVGEVLAALPVTVIDIDVVDGRLVKIMSDGTRLPGPVLPGGGGDPVDPTQPQVALISASTIITPTTLIRGQS